MLHRRDFLTLSTALIASGCLAGRKPKPKDAPVRIAQIGVGGRGTENLNGLLGAGADIAAVCDVDSRMLENALRRPLQDARAFADMRELFARRHELELDGVLVSTADHTHAFATALALRAGLPVYTEKPLTRTIEESRRLRELAEAAQVPTQLGTQIHAYENYRRVVELVRSGAIGTVRSVDTWVPKGWCCGPQAPIVAPPATLNYDLWLGPAQMRPYVKDLHPSNWRKYWDYGTGTLGDMGCHMLDLPVWALGLDRSRLGVAEVRAQVSGVDRNGTPEWTEASWAIAQTEGDPLVLRWFDGGRKSPTAQELGAKDGINYHERFTILFQGSEGFLWANYDEHLITPAAAAAKPRAALERIAASPGHYSEWIEAIRAWRGGAQGTAEAPLCSFSRATTLNELVLSGTVAGRAGRALRYDFGASRFVDSEPLPAWQETPRAGWSLSDEDLDRVLG